MLAEILRNARSAEALAIADAIDRSKQFHKERSQTRDDMKKAKWWELFRMYADQNILEATIQQSGIAMAEAKARWFLQVRANGPWDHKPILKKMYEAMGIPPRPFGSLGRSLHFPVRGDIFREYYYDIWSNIHYGYIGARCGFDDETLQEGAASGFPGAGNNDEGDVISVGIGIGLWKSSGTAINADSIRKAIVSNASNYEAARNREIRSGVRPEDATNVVITEND